MKKIISTLIISVLLVNCLPMSGTPMTAFIIKNTSDSPISFNASVFKYSQSFGRQEISNTFTVKAHDSIIARQTNFKKDSTNPQNWFFKFNIFPTDGLEMNDPTQSQNWVKSSKNNVPTYTFRINK